MPDITAADIAADFDDIRAAIPEAAVTVSINGNSYNGFRTRLHRLPELTDVGIRDNFQFSVIVEVADLDAADTPIPFRTDVTVDGVTYRCINSKDDPLQATLRIDLGKL